MTTTIKSLTVISVILLTSLSGCNSTPPSSQSKQQVSAATTTSGQIPSAPANDPDAQASLLMAAAEPFENLTESAFISDPVKLDKFIADAKASADSASKLLAQPEAKKLYQYVAAIDAARAGNNRADLAIAAVEGYRTLVSNVTIKMKVPNQVSLLDYSGFRYQADLKANPVRWSDSVRAVEFANAQWQQISAKVTDLSLRKDMSQTLDAMRAAGVNKDAKAAMAASTHELDLVDGLESYFAKSQ